MKKFLIGAGVVLFLLILVALILFKAVAPASEDAQITEQHDPFQELSSISSSIDNSSPRSTIATCFDWYIRASLRGVDSSILGFQPEGLSCFTEDFIREWHLIVDDVGVDPVLLTDAVQSEWLNQISMQQEKVLQRAVHERVTLGRTGDPSSRTIVVQVKQEISGNSWKIDSVSEVP